MKLFNTLTQKIEEFVPLEPGRVGMYTCGPTVYHYVHIGNFRTFIFQDLLRRYLLYKGFELTHVMNITDVEDKIIANALEEGVPIQEYTARYSAAFLEDMRALRIQEPEIMPRATEHIPEMIDLVRQLQERGLTYISEGSTYFRIGQFEDYGKLAGIDTSAVSGEGRLDEDEYSKENPRDFVLWKSRRSGETWWDSPFGEGRPGWHLECSAMSMKYLGKSFDIHCGGIDLIFPHHENEIAQSQGATGEPFVRYWLHGAHLIVEGEKMSKSKGNFYTLRDLLEKGYNPLALRYLLSTVHYRNQLNFTFDALQQAQAALARVNDFLLKVSEIPDDVPENSGLTSRIAAAKLGFEAGMDSDLNVSEALAALFELIRETNILLDRREVGTGNAQLILQLFAGANQIFDVFQLEREPFRDTEIEKLIQDRKKARLEREYARADEIRDLLAARGIILEDTKEGTRWKKVN